MANLRTYYYDHEACTFVEVKPSRGKLMSQLGLMFIVSILLVAALAWLVGGRFGTPEELALREENRFLQSKLEETVSRMNQFSTRLEALAQTDEELYRTILQEQPISDDVRQVGIGGTETYEEYRRFSTDTRALLRNTTDKLDQLERQLDLQSKSYRSLLNKAEKRSDALKEMPSIRPAGGRLVSGFGIRLHPIDRVRKMHHGLDFVVPVGSSIYATGDGVVSFVGRNGGFGIVVEITHPVSGYMTRYAHLSSTLVRQGQRISRGDIIAKSGNTGRSTGPHLHYEVRDARGNSLNPIDFFAPSMTPEAYMRLLKEADQSDVSLD